MITVTLTLSSTDNVDDPPPDTLLFENWENFPELPKKIITTTRRLGSRQVIRQEIGEESNLTTCNVTVGFEDSEDEQGMESAKLFVESVRKAMDPTTYYTLTDSGGNITIYHVMIVDILSYRIKRVKGYHGLTGTESLDENIAVLEMSLSCMVDGGSQDVGEGGGI